MSKVERDVIRETGVGTSGGRRSTFDLRPSTKLARAATTLALAGAAMTMGCRGGISEESPFHLIPDMDHQPKFKAQAANEFFTDGRAMRPLVDGTLAQGQYHEDEGPYTGKNPDGSYLTRIPTTVDEKVLARGQERFNIYCSPCHDKTGAGQGLVIKRGYPLPINLAGDHAKGLKDGEVFDIVSNGIRNMPGYRTQVPAADRWAIVSWVRVLQRSQNAKIDDVPADKKGSIEPEMAPQ
jgi:mono/diheme cytochrome c family protein